MLSKSLLIVYRKVTPNNAQLIKVTAKGSKSCELLVTWVKEMGSPAREPTSADIEAVFMDSHLSISLLIPSLSFSAKDLSSGNSFPFCDKVRSASSSMALASTISL